MSINCEHAETDVLAVDFNRLGEKCSETVWCKFCGAHRDPFKGPGWTHTHRKYKPRIKAAVTMKG